MTKKGALSLSRKSEGPIFVPFPAPFLSSAHAYFLKYVMRGGEERGGKNLQKLAASDFRDRLLCLGMKLAILSSSLFCFTLLHSDPLPFPVSITADSGSGSLRWALTQANLAGVADIPFNLPPGPPIITLLSGLPSISAELVTINMDPSAPFVTIDGAGSSPIFIVESGEVHIARMNLINAASVGGVGGACYQDLRGAFIFSSEVGAGGGGGLGAGGGIFVNAGATALLTDVAFHSNRAVGGQGGFGINYQPPIPTGLFFFGGGGGGGALYGAQALGGTGGFSSTWGPGGGPPMSAIAGGGGGGGGGSTPGAFGMAGTGPTLNYFLMTGGTGGEGGGSPGGAGGRGGLGTTGAAGWGGDGLSSFEGGGGGGGAGGSAGGPYFPFAGGGGNGAACGGGGGAGVAWKTDRTRPGGAGGFGGGGGGGGASLIGLLLSEGGAGGFGAGGGGGYPAGSSIFAGGKGGEGNSSDYGGGGGAGLGGGLFLGPSGALILRYTNPTLGSTAISGNSATGGSGGGAESQNGGSYGQDLFFGSGANLTFFLDVPLTISSAIQSDPLYAGHSLLNVKGSNTLTLLGDNTFDGMVKVSDGGQLAIQNEGNLGLTASGMASFVLDSGTLFPLSSTFTLTRPLSLGDEGGILNMASGVTALFSGPIASSVGPYFIGGITISGSGTAQFSGHNTYEGQTIINSSATLQIVQLQGLPSNSPIILNGGILDLTSVTGAINNSISGSGTVMIEAGGNPTLMGNNTYNGTTQIASGATLSIGAPAGISPNATVIDNGILSCQYSGNGVAGPIIGSGSVTISGGGALYLNSADTYSGGTLLNNGTAQISAPSALGSGVVNFMGGTLELINSPPFSGTLTATLLMRSAGGTIQVDSGVSALSVSLLHGIGGFSCTGGGTLALAGTCAYSGITTVGTATTLSLLSTGTLLAGSAVGKSVIDWGTLQFNIPLATVNYSTSGSGAVSIGGDITFQGMNTYFGSTTINPGAILTLANPLSYPQQSTPVIDNGLLNFDFSSPSLTATVAGSLTGTGALEVEEGTITLLGINTYGGTTTIGLSGTLIVGESAALPLSSLITDNGLLLFSHLTGTAEVGPIQGVGVVAMSGTGASVFLQSSDTYSGGTLFNSGSVLINAASALGSGPLTFNGGILELQFPFSGTLAMTATLQAGGGIIQPDANVTALYSGSITGPGPFTCTGAGTLELSGLNGYTNSTTIGSDAVLEILLGASLPSTSPVFDYGSLLFSLTSPTSIIPNFIQESGTVSLSGPNLFSLTHTPNTYSGGTFVSMGTLLEPNFSYLGSGSLTLQDGATLHLSGSDSISRSLILGSGGGEINLDPGVTLTDFGFISSLVNDAPLLLIGQGTLVFSGTDVSSSLTTLGDGSFGSGNLDLVGGTFLGPVNVSAPSTLSGYGNVGELHSWGSVTIPSPQQLNVTGEFTQEAGAFLTVSLQPDGGCSEIVVQGASLDGTLNVNVAPGSYLKGLGYTVLSSHDRFYSAFSNLVLPPSPPLFPLYVDDSSLMLFIYSPHILDGASVFGYNPNQVLHNLQQIAATPSVDLIHVLTLLSDLDSAALTQALDQLHPAPFGAFELLNVNTASLLTSIFSRHGAETCCLHSKQKCGCTNMSLWVHPFGYLYDQDRIGEQVGFHANSKGLSTGFNFCSTGGFLFGLAGAFSSSDLSWKEGRGHGCMDKASLALYGDCVREKFSVEASILGSLDQFTATRSIRFPGLQRSAHHQKGGYDMTGHLGFEGEISAGSFFFVPFLDEDYLYLYQKPFSESGADSLNLVTKGRRSHLLRSELGLGLTRSFAMGKRGCFAPTLSLGGINEYYLVKSPYVATLAHEKIPFEVNTFRRPITMGSSALDLSFMFEHGLSAAVRYALEVNKEVLTQKLDARLEWFF